MTSLSVKTESVCMMSTCVMVVITVETTVMKNGIVMIMIMVNAVLLDMRVV